MYISNNAALPPAQLDPKYLTVTSQNEVVFQSQPNVMLRLGEFSPFHPVEGRTYHATATVQKTAAGNVALLTPCFDLEYANGMVITASGSQTSGLGAANGTVDTTSWPLNTWQTISCAWTATDTGAARARMRLEINDNPSSASYSNAVFEVSKFSFREDAVSGSYDWNEIVDSRTGVDAAWVERPSDPYHAFPQRPTLTAQPGDLPMSGYVRTDEVDYIVYSSADVPSLYSNDDVTETLLNGQYVWIHDTGTTWDVQRIFNMSADNSPNSASKFVTNTEDGTVSSNVTRVYMTNATGLTAADVGAFVIFNADTETTPDLFGVQIIDDIDPSGAYFDVANAGSHGFDFTDQTTTDFVAPSVRIMRTCRFPDMATFSAYKLNQPGLGTGDLAFVDGSPWRVFEYADAYCWPIKRKQPHRMDATKIASSLIYDLKTEVTDTELLPQPLMLSDFAVISPAVGLISGLAKDQIDYMLSYDPADYYQAPWGIEHVGRVWWDLRTVRFLETESDDVAFGLTADDRYFEEIKYRINNWGQIAANTSVDVYEWTRSTITPDLWANAVATDTTGTYTGSVLPPDDLGEYTFNISEELDNSTASIGTYYYFWVKNVQSVPNVSFRTRDVATVARLITNPLAEDQPWMAPVLQNGLLVGGAGPFLDDQFNTTSDYAVDGTVMQIDVTTSDFDGVEHEAWTLIRPNDELSLPPDWLWAKLRDSLVGFDDFGDLLPKPYVPLTGAPVINQPPIVLPNNWVFGSPPIADKVTWPYNSDFYHSDYNPPPIPQGYSSRPFYAKLVANDTLNLPLTYTFANSSTLPTGLSLNAQTGEITGACPMTQTQINADFALTATSPTGANATYEFALNIDPEVVNFQNVSKSGVQIEGNADDYVTQPVPALDSIYNPLTYTSSALPGSLSIDPSSGTISGDLPDTAATYTATVYATSNTGVQASCPVTILVDAVEQTPDAFYAYFAGYGTVSEMTCTPGVPPYVNTSPATVTEYLLPNLPGSAIERPAPPASNHIIYAAINMGTPFASWTFDGTSASPAPVTYFNGALQLNPGDYITFTAAPLQTYGYWFPYYAPDGDPTIYSSPPPLDLGAVLSNPVTVVIAASITQDGLSVTNEIDFPGYPQGSS